MAPSTDHKNLKYYFPGLSIMKRSPHGWAGTINKSTEALMRSEIVFLRDGLAQAKNRQKPHPSAHPQSQEESSEQGSERLAAEDLLRARPCARGPSELHALSSFPQLALQQTFPSILTSLLWNYHHAHVSDEEIWPQKTVMFPVMTRLVSGGADLQTRGRRALS